MVSKFTKRERLEIGRQVYDRELNRHQAAVKYGVDISTIRDYMRLYKATLEIQGEIRQEERMASKIVKPYDAMTKSELIAELKRLTGEE